MVMLLWCLLYVSRVCFVVVACFCCSVLVGPVLVGSQDLVDDLRRRENYVYICIYIYIYTHKYTHI